MCNAHNHPPECDCGFGGEGHLGGGADGVYSTLSAATSSFAVFSGYGYPLRELALELGYSIVFHTICRYCGAEIYLFANPNGGFAIFDSLGVPWPKHGCTETLTNPGHSKSEDRAMGDIYNLSDHQRWTGSQPPERHIEYLSPTIRLLRKYGESNNEFYNRLPEKMALRQFLIGLATRLVKDLSERRMRVEDDVCFEFYVCDLPEGDNLLIVCIHESAGPRHYWVLRPVDQVLSQVDLPKDVWSKLILKLPMSQFYRRL